MGALPEAHCLVSFSLQLRKQTGARIDVDTEDVGDERVLLISGFPVQVCKAKAAIHQILTENTPVSEQLSVPQRSVGRIIGITGRRPPLFPFLLCLSPHHFFEATLIKVTQSLIQQIDIEFLLCIRH